MPRTTTTLDSSYKKAADIEARFGREDAAAAINAFKNAPLELPGNGKYLVKLQAGELHIYETVTGVIKYKPTDASGIEFKGDRIELNRYGHPISKIVLHTTPVSEDPRAISPKDLKALPFIEEFERIGLKGTLTLEDKERRVELLELINKAYNEVEVDTSKSTLPPAEEEVKKAAAAAKKTPTRPTYTPPVSPGYGGGRSYGRSSG